MTWDLAIVKVRGGFRPITEVGSDDYVPLGKLKAVQTAIRKAFPTAEWSNPTWAGLLRQRAETIGDRLRSSTEEATVAIDDTGAWWVGSEAGDIEPYLRAYTESEAAYPMTVFRAVHCTCGGDRFHLERAGDIVQRVCSACSSHHLICRQLEDWEEAVEEEGSEPYWCVACGGSEANVGVGFAGYGEAPNVDGVKWFYVGVRCASCGVLGCFGDGKVGWGPAAEVYRQA